eukprot:PhF_6_TR21022/c0_g1_i1/m.30217/K08869/ADCK, ABC1; aarF domain-containing kinase
MRRFMRGLGYVGVTSGICVGIDYSCDHVISRNIRCMSNAAIVAYEYKTFDGDMDQLSALHQRTAERILHVCLTNEGLYVKLGQALSTFNHIMPPEWTDTLKVLLDRAKETDSELMFKVLEKELGKSHNEIFKTFNTKPVASASIAQVYYATLQDGTPVAVKILKPSIEVQMPWDLFCYRFLLWAFEKGFNMPLQWTYEYSSSSLRQEMDFLLEADFADETAKHFQHRKDFHVPKVFRELTTRRVLVTEWIDGAKLSEPDTLRKHRFNLQTALQCYMEVFADMIFKYGVVHCDPHPGNVLVRYEPGTGKQQLVLLDHGLTIRESAEFRHTYALFWRAIFLQDVETVKQVVHSWGITEIETFVSMQLLKPYSMKRPIHSQEITKEHIREMQHNIKHKLVAVLSECHNLPQELVMVGRCVALLRGVNKSHGAPVNRINIFAERAVASLEREGKGNNLVWWTKVSFWARLHMVSAVH